MAVPAGYFDIVGRVRLDDVVFDDKGRRFYMMDAMFDCSDDADQVADRLREVGVSDIHLCVKNGNPVKVPYASKELQSMLSGPSHGTWFYTDARAKKGDNARSEVIMAMCCGLREGRYGLEVDGSKVEAPSHPERWTARHSDGVHVTCDGWDLHREHAAQVSKALISEPQAAVPSAAPQPQGQSARNAEPSSQTSVSSPVPPGAQGPVSSRTPSQPSVPQVSPPGDRVRSDDPKGRMSGRVRGPERMSDEEFRGACAERMRSIETRADKALADEVFSSIRGVRDPSVRAFLMYSKAACETVGELGPTRVPDGAIGNMGSVLDEFVDKYCHDSSVVPKRCADNVETFVVGMRERVSGYEAECTRERRLAGLSGSVTPGVPSDGLSRE